MNLLSGVLAAVFWVSVLTVFYVYLGFPLCLVLLTLGRKFAAPSELPDEELPTVSLLVAAHNEELVIETKLANCLKLDYPPEKLEFVFVSDSSDSTNKILLRAQSNRLTAHILNRQVGKLAALREAFPLCRGEIVTLSDANTYYYPDAIRKLVRHFQDPRVGLVTGDVRLLASDQKFGAGERLYYRYERYLQALESRFWSTVVIDGAMYALRRIALRFPGPGPVPDDLVIGMNVGLQGYRMLYDPEAIAEEDPTPTDTLEFSRKVRIVASGLRAVLDSKGVPSIRQTRLWWVYVSHKLLRWFVPFFLVAALLASAGAAAVTDAPFWIVVFALQAVFYAMGVVGCRAGEKILPVRVAYYFGMVNFAALVGILRGLRNRQSESWKRTDRVRMQG